MEIRKMLTFPFKAFTGVNWSKDQVDQYNRLQAQINTALNAGVYPEHLVNGSHNMFSAFSFQD